MGQRNIVIFETEETYYTDSLLIVCADMYPNKPVIKRENGYYYLKDNNHCPFGGVVTKFDNQLGQTGAYITVYTD